MRICLIAGEIFAWGKYGGFGRATRTIGAGLVRHGHEVCAVVPRREGQPASAWLDGIEVWSFPPRRPWQARALFRRCDAQIYHSQEPSSASWLALQAMPERRHAVTFRDPRDRQDWWIELRHPTLRRHRTLLTLVYENNPLVRRAVLRADARFAASELAAEKAVAVFGLPQRPTFLPTPVAVPESVTKADRPTVCFLSRWDRRKQPERFFELARRFPDVRFLAAGKAHDPQRDSRLRQTYGRLPNLTLLPFLDQFANPEFRRLLESAWVFVNTAEREGLPNAFLEAAAHRCAILSGVDPDRFASRFGHHAADGDFARGLACLLEGDRWRQLGEEACRCIRNRFESTLALQRHLEEYSRLLELPREK